MKSLTKFLPFILLLLMVRVQPAFSSTQNSILIPTPTPISPLVNINNTSIKPTVIQVPLANISAVTFGPDEYPYFINPLTGLKVEDLSLLERRPIAVKVTNYPRGVRPQFGLPKADIIFEYYLERQAPRFVALYYGQNAEKVGPIRSGRLFDEHIMRMYDSFLVFGNADDRIIEYMLDLGNSFISSLVVEQFHELACPKIEAHYLCVDPDISGYNNLFTNIKSMEEFLTNRNKNYRPGLSGMYFSLQPPANGELTNEIRVKYSYLVFHKWMYDSSTNSYLRFQEPFDYDPLSGVKSYVPHIDAASGEQLSATNIVVMKVPHSYYVKSSTTEIYNIALHGKGEAFIFRDGFYFPATWKRKESTGVLELFDLDGNPFPLKPGQTWYQVISDISGDNQNGTVWDFAFEPPPWDDRYDEPIDVVIGEDPLFWFFTSQNPELPFPNSD